MIAVSCPKVAEYYAMALAKGVRQHGGVPSRSGRLPESQVVDLYFQDFITDQVGTVRRAYEHFGLELSDEAANAMQSFLDENPADKYGRHLYSFADTGMDERELRKLFHDYQTYFDVPSEAV